MTGTRQQRRSTSGANARGPRLLGAAERERLERRAATGGLASASWARMRLQADANRRANHTEHPSGGANGVRVTGSGVAGAGGGRWRSIARPPEWRGTTAQLAGLWPWCVGAGAPLLGTPLGSHLSTGAPVCFDPLNWFSRGNYLTAPSLFVLGLNGFGKSSLVRRIVLGGIAQGVTPLVLADVKPDYRATVTACGGQVVDVGYGHGQLNPLDPGLLGHAMHRLQAAGLDEAAASVDAELRARQTNLLAGLVELIRGERIADFEDTLISTALRLLYAPAASGGRGFTPDAPPILDDLLEVITCGSEELMLDAAAATPERYAEAVVPLRRSLRALTRGPFGQVFNGPTTVGLDLDAPAICVDVSHIPSGDTKLKAAVMLACWAIGFGSVEALNMLAEAGLEHQRVFQVVMDELWQVLGLGEFMVTRVDELTRLQRSLGVALIMISHSVRDLHNIGGTAGARALGFLERSRAKILGALPAEEIALLDGIVKLTDAETDMVTSWSAPQALTGEPLRAGMPRPTAAGVGKFLLKVSEDRTPGLGFQLLLTQAEQSFGIHATSERFRQFGQSTPQGRAA
ncbi:hypothetical protein [Nocardia alni]|uniref:hypothetical protein n=1 Tax=Nocardia alni TaxID=2815723 RepID=UPI0020B2B11C|nr:hypothetical protein [Nocardia alni]